MSNILDLPLYQITAGVQSNEDWTFDLTFTLSDGVTPLSLSGITFTAFIGDSYEVGGTVSGGVANTLSFYAPAAVVSTWEPGTYPLTILAEDAAPHFRDLAGYSSLTVGAPQLACFLQLLCPAGETNVIITPIPPYQTVQAILSGLPNVLAGDPIPQAGIFYVNASGFVVLSLATSGPTVALGAAALTAQGILSTLPNLVAGTGDQIPPVGLFFVDASGYVVQSL